MGLLATLRRPLWSESAAARRRRLLRQWITLPPMLAAGAIWGVLSTMATNDERAVIVGGLAGALAFGLGSRLYLQIQPFISWWASTRFPRWGGWVGTALDSLLAGSAVWLLTDVLALPTYSSVTAVVTLGGGYAAVVAAFFDEPGTRALGGVLGTIRGGGLGIRIPPYSHIEAMRVQRRLDEARAALEEFVQEHPGDARGWLDLGRLLADEFGERDEAVRVIRTGIDRARMDLRVHHHYVQTLLRIRESDGAPHLAGRDLAFLSDVAGAAPEGEWARRMLADLRARDADPDAVD